MEIVKFRNWKFEVDKLLTIETYDGIVNSGTNLCGCNDCKNYIAYREKVFPEDVRVLFLNLGIDYNKEVEICSYQILPNGLHHISGWFHFIGKIIEGESCRNNIGNKGYTIELTDIGSNFSIGFCEESSLTFFENKDEIVQIEFEAHIPWIIDKGLEI
jgi:hypothetical protein